MNVRYLIGLSLLLIGCPDETRFESADIIDAEVAPQQDQEIDQPDTNTDVDAMDSMDIGVSEDAATLDADTTDADLADAQTANDASAVDANTPPTMCTVRFTAVLPSNTDASDNVFLAGTFCQNDCGGSAGECCNWIPNDEQWSEAVTPRMDNVAVFETTLTPDVDYEYKYTLGSWETEELREDCEPIANRLVRADCPNGDVYQVQDVVDAWKGRCN